MFGSKKRANGESGNSRGKVGDLPAVKTENSEKFYSMKEIAGIFKISVSDAMQILVHEPGVLAARTDTVAEREAALELPRVPAGVIERNRSRLALLGERAFQRTGAKPPDSAAHNS